MIASDSADSIYLTDSEEEAEQFQGNTMKQLRKAEIVCKIIKLNFSIGFVVYPVMCVMLLFVQVVRVVLLGKIPVRPPRGAQW